MYSIFQNNRFSIIISKYIESLITKPNMDRTQKSIFMQCLVIPFDSNATKAFTQVEQGLDEPFHMYVHHINEFLSKIYHTSDMSRISAYIVEG